MRYIVIFLLCMLLAKYGKAQSSSITGKVIDGSGKPIAFASIFVFKKNANNNKPITGKITTDDGSFKLTIEGDGSYIIKATYTSYNDFTQEVQVKGSVNLEPIVLTQKENKLNEVTITASPPIITKKTDRLVMNVQNNALAAGKSSLELMNLAPGVFVSDGKISINGNPGTRVMVDGKMLQLSGDDLTNYLNSLRADEIQSIEVIAHPPAEYDAEGSGGYINIILKKQKRAGFNGSANADYTQGRYGSTTEGVQLNFKKDKLALFAVYAFDKTKDYEDSKFSRTINDSIKYHSLVGRINDYTVQRLHTGGIYDIDSKQYIGVDYNGVFASGNTPYNSTINITYPNSINNQNVVGTYPRTNSRDYNNIGFNYHLVLDSVGSSFVFFSDYTENNVQAVSSAQSNFYDNNNVFLNDTSFRNQTPSEARIYTADAKYTKAITKASVLSIGAKLTATSIDNSAAYESLNNNIWVNEPSLNYIYDYKENILAGYMNYNGKLFNTDVQLGLRGENTNTNGNLVTSNIDTKRNYFNLFPTLYLKHGTNKSNSDYLTFYYGRRIERPSYSDLNPYEFNADNYTIGKGNPYLNPSFTNSFELGYTLNNKYSITASYDRQKAVIAQYASQSVTDSLVTIYTHANFGNRTNASIIIYTPLDITNWWSLNNNIILSRQSISAQDIFIQRNIFNIQSNQSFALPSQFNIDLSVRYYSNIISGNFLLNPIFTTDIGVQKKLYKNRLIIKAAMNDVFNTYKLNGNIYYTNTDIGIMEQRRQTQTFNLSLAYNFDLGQAFKAKKVESSNADEQRRLQ